MSSCLLGLSQQAKKNNNNKPVICDCCQCQQQQDQEQDQEHWGDQESQVTAGGRRAEDVAEATETFRRGEDSGTVIRTELQVETAGDVPGWQRSLHRATL